MSPTTLLWLITGCLMLQPLSTDLYLPSLPHLVKDLAVTPAAVQQTLSWFVAGFGGAQLISGPLSDRYGRRPVLLSGLTLYACASLACAFAPTLDWLISARFLQALGCCTAVVVVRTIVRDSYDPTEGARVIAKASSLLSIAPLVGPIAGGYLQVAFGWQAAFVVLFSYGLLLLFAATMALQETNRSLNPEATQPRRLLAIYLSIAHTPAFWAYALPGALSYAGIFIFISGSSFVLIQVLNVSTEFYGVLFAVGVLGYLGGTLLCRRRLATHGIGATLALGTTVGLIGGVVFLGVTITGLQHWSIVVLAQFSVMGAHGINFPCAQAGSVGPFPTKAGAAAGLFGALCMSVALIVGIWVAHSYDATVMPLALTTAAIMTTLYAVTRLLHRRSHTV